MTDLDSFRAMLTRRGIPFKEKTLEANPGGVVPPWDAMPWLVAPFVPLKGRAILIEADWAELEDSPKVIGYRGFWQAWIFGEAGELVCTGAWE